MAWRGETQMKCPKCEGLMTNFKHYGFGTDLVGSFYGWHCLCCGEILDPVIVANRARSTNLAIGPRVWTGIQAKEEVVALAES